MKKIVGVVAIVLLLLVLSGCGKGLMNPAAQQPTANVEPQKSDVEQIAKQLPPPPVEQPKPQPQPAPPPAPKTTTTQNNGTIKPVTFVKNTPSQTPYVPKQLTSMTFDGTVHSIDGVNLDRGTVMTGLGKQYKYYDRKDLKLGDKVQFQIDGNYNAINIKVIPQTREQTNLTTR